MLIYESDKVTIKLFQFKNFSFRLINLFENFIIEKEPIVVKISCYDMEFLMPVVYTLKLYVNLLSYNGSL